MIASGGQEWESGLQTRGTSDSWVIGEVVGLQRLEVMGGTGPGQGRAHGGALTSERILALRPLAMPLETSHLSFFTLLSSVEWN